MRDLYAVVGPKGTICAECAEKKFGTELETMPEDDSFTTVLKSDAWRHDVDGPCAECLEEVDG